MPNSPAPHLPPDVAVPRAEDDGPLDPDELTDDEIDDLADDDGFPDDDDFDD